MIQKEIHPNKYNSILIGLNIELEYDYNAFIKDWNSRNFFDRWWRKKYKIPFGSTAHLEMNHLFMSLEYKEDKIFDNLNDDIDTFNANSDNILIKAGIRSKSTKENSEIKLTGKTLDDEFNNLDIKQFQ